MSPSDFHVFLHTCHRRLGKIGETLASLDASDIRGRYVVENQHTGEIPMSFWANAMSRGFFAGKRFIVRLEDDIVVAPRLLEALAAWPALEDPAFGMGLLCLGWYPHQGGLVERPELRAWESSLSHNCPAMAQVFSRASIIQIIKHVRRSRTHWWRWSSRPMIDFDVSVSEACTALRLKVFVHNPMLVRPAALHDRSTHEPPDGRVPPRIPAELVDLGFAP
jgi:hypothetical protein